MQDPAGNTFTGSTEICSDQGRVVFPAAGTYQLVVIGSPGSGRIDAPGARDLWKFSLPAAGKVHFTPDKSCTPGRLTWQMQQADGGSLSGSSDICDDLGDLTLPAGSYQLVVISDGPGTGEYSFTSSTG